MKILVGNWQQDKKQQCDVPDRRNLNYSVGGEASTWAVRFTEIPYSAPQTLVRVTEGLFSPGR